MATYISQYNNNNNIYSYSQVLKKGALHTKVHTLNIALQHTLLSTYVVQ